VDRRRHNGTLTREADAVRRGRTAAVGVAGEGLLARAAMWMEHLAGDAATESSLQTVSINRKGFYPCLYLYLYLYW
jgi:hypothetical protein